MNAQREGFDLHNPICRGFAWREFKRGGWRRWSFLRLVLVDTWTNVCPPPLPITRAQWLERCAARFKSKAGLSDVEAGMYAESQFENVGEDLTESPEGAADDEMSYWGQDDDLLS